MRDARAHGEARVASAKGMNMNESTCDPKQNHAMTSEELAAMLKQPVIREAIRDIIVDLATRREFVAYPGLNLPGNGRR